MSHFFQLILLSCRFWGTRESGLESIDFFHTSPEKMHTQFVDFLFLSHSLCYFFYLPKKKRLNSCEFIERDSYHGRKMCGKCVRQRAGREKWEEKSKVAGESLNFELTIVENYEHAVAAQQQSVWSICDECKNCTLCSVMRKLEEDFSPF